MNLLLLGNRDLASNVAFNCLIPNLQHHTLQIGLSDKVGGQKSVPRRLQELKFVEQQLFNEMLFPMLENLPASGYRTFEQLSEATGRRLMTLNSINSEAERDLVAAFEPDLIISIRFGVILKRDVIRLPTYGVINLHSGLLPEYRGVMATFWALFNDESVIGTTLHYIDDAAIDEGRIISRQTFPVDRDQSYLWHVLQLYPGGCDQIVSAINNIERGEQVPAVQQAGEGAYYSFPDESTLNHFEDKGYKLFNGQEVIEQFSQYFSNQ